MLQGEGGSRDRLEDIGRNLVGFFFSLRIYDWLYLGIRRNR